MAVCDLSSSNKDELEWTQKRHEMLLDLEFSSKNAATGNIFVVISIH